VAGAGGTVTPATGLKTVGTPITLLASPIPGYDFTSWTTGSTVTTNPSLTITPTVDATYTAAFQVHVLTVADYNAIEAFLTSYYTACGLIGNTPNAAKATRMLPSVILIESELRMYDLAVSLSLNPYTHYANILSVLNSFYPVIVPIV
jgi:uncharacterized repeat protein (TIGR02543 family)